MAGFVLVVAAGAQWSHLIVCPLLTGDSICRTTPIAETPCDPAAIDAWPEEHRPIAHREHLDARHRVTHRISTTDHISATDICV